ncbi:MAG: hypothetical protein WDW38_000614 [Sanguina aurantia]
MDACFVSRAPPTHRSAFVTTHSGAHGAYAFTAAMRMGRCLDPDDMVIGALCDLRTSISTPSPTRRVRWCPCTRAPAPTAAVGTSCTTPSSTRYRPLRRDPRGRATLDVFPVIHPPLWSST